MSLLAVFQVQPVTQEPIVVGGVIALFGLVYVWQLVTTLQVRDSVRDLASEFRTVMYGPKDGNGTPGLMQKVEKHEDRIGTLELRMNLRRDD